MSKLRSRDPSPSVGEGAAEAAGERHLPPSLHFVPALTATRASDISAAVRT